MADAGEVKGYSVRIVSGAFVVEGHREGRGPSLEYLQRCVGGYIQPVSFAQNFEERDMIVWVNEEGRLLDLPQWVFVDYGEGYDPVAGDVVVTGGVDAAGETKWLTKEQAEQVRVVERNGVAVLTLAK